MTSDGVANAVVWILVIGGIIAAVIWSDGSSSGGYSSSSYDDYGGYEEEIEFDRDDAIDQYWESIREYLNGSETVEACSSQSGNCYDLDAEISSGRIEEIYFPEGGYLYFSADIDSNGYASDYDQDGEAWDFSFDMGSSIVDDAISDWMSDHAEEYYEGYEDYSRY